MSVASLFHRLRARLLGALADFLARPVRPASQPDVADTESLAHLLRPGDVLLTEGVSRASAIVRRVTRSPWAHVSMYVGPLEDGADPRCIVEADITAGVRAVPLSEFKGQRARIVRPMGLDDGQRRRVAEWVVGRVGDPYDLAHAWALARWLLRLAPRPKAMAQDARRFICSTLLAQAFLLFGHPVAAADVRHVVPRDFETASGFEVVKTA